MSELGIESFRVRSIEAIQKPFALVMVTLAMLVELFEGAPLLVELICKLGRWLGLKKEKPIIYKLRWGAAQLAPTADTYRATLGLWVNSRGEPLTYDHSRSTLSTSTKALGNHQRRRLRPARRA